MYKSIYTDPLAPATNYGQAPSLQKFQKAPKELQIHANRSCTMESRQYSQPHEPVEDLQEGRPELSSPVPSNDGTHERGATPSPTTPEESVIHATRSPPPRLLRQPTIGKRSRFRTPPPSTWDPHQSPNADSTSESEREEFAQDPDQCIEYDQEVYPPVERGTVRKRCHGTLRLCKSTMEQGTPRVASPMGQHSRPAVRSLINLVSDTESDSSENDEPRSRVAASKRIARRLDYGEETRVPKTGKIRDPEHKIRRQEELRERPGSPLPSWSWVGSKKVSGLTDKIFQPVRSASPAPESEPSDGETINSEPNSCEDEEVWTANEEILLCKLRERVRILGRKRKEWVDKQVKSL